MKTATLVILAITTSALAHTDFPGVQGRPHGDIREGSPLTVHTRDIRATTDFYAHLAPHGRWLRVAHHGLVWQPNVAVTGRSWHPYCNEGQWVWTDRGWYWQSTYSWGWAPFHYGRWRLCPERGWYWVPDTVWAPAWVHWRYSDSHFGWAPLPPGATFQVGVGLHFGGGSASLDCHFGLTHGHYTFVEHRHFLSSNLSLVISSRRSYPTICRSTTVIRHGLSCSGSHVVHYGLPVATVGRSCRHSIRMHRIVCHRPATTTTIVRPSHSHTTYRVPSYHGHRTVVTRPASVYYSTPRTCYSHGRGSRRTTVVHTPAPSRSSSSRTQHVSSSPRPAPSSRSSSSSSGAIRPSSSRTSVSSSAGRRSDRLKHIVKRR